MELGGCCLTRYGTIAAVLPSKADRIMSRYRPIAPKPMALSMPPLSETDRSISSVVSLDTRPVLDASRVIGSRRARKRRTDCVASPSRGSKRAAVSVKSDSNRERSSVSNGGCAAERKVAGVGRNQADAGSGGGVFGGRGGARSCVSMETTESSQASVLAGASAVAAGAVSSGLIESTRMMEQDVGFMERAAASAPPSVLPDSRVTARSPGSGGFTEMIRGITGLPSAADVYSLLQPSRSCADGMPSCSSSSLDFAYEGFSIAAAPAFCEQIHGESSVSQEQQEGRNAELVTLPLLPNAPSRADSPSSDSSISTCDLRGQPSQDRKDVFGSSGSRTNSFSLFGDEARPATNHLKDSLCDLAFIEQIYGSSSEPVLLVDDTKNILWLNRAYDRALKDAIERQAGKSALVVPFIDPLGIPTQLGRFNMQLQGRGCLWTTLWGFLKKFVVDAGPDGGYSPSLSGLPVKKSNTFNHTDTSHRTGDPTAAKLPFRSLGIADCASGKKSGVIVPQPIRLVGSTVSLESVTDIQAEASPLSESLELLKKQLEEGASPAFITDSSNLVRWVNIAYKRMVGQPECPWLASTVSDSKMGSSQTSPLPSPLLTGEVLLVSNVDIPQWAPAFSGRANIQWTNTGEKSCMTVPCDVSRLDECCTGKVMLVWKFDIDASLRLTCGV